MTEGWREAVLEAARSGDVDVVKDVLATSPEAASARTEQGTPILHIAAEGDHVDVILLLLDSGADLEAEAPWGQTAFEWAANMGSDASAELFLDRGAERESLWTAAALGRLDEVRDWFDEGGGLLPDAGRLPRPGADLSGWPEDTAFLSGDPVSDAFYIACRNGFADVARYLLSQGADRNSRGYFGATALHWAAINGHDAVVEMLVAAGADRTARDPEFDATPAGWAREGGHEALARALDSEKTEP